MVHHRISIPRASATDLAPGGSEHQVRFTDLVPDADGAVVLAVTLPPGSDVGGWHRHDRGQYLESISGTGWVRELGGAPLMLEPGDRIWCPPGVVHQHGAGPDAAWVQFSVTPGGTEWLTPEQLDDCAAPNGGSRS